jgi:hypothetical protein
MDALIPPIPPAQLAVERRDAGNLLSWLGTGSDIDTHYIVYQRTSANDTWQAIGYVAVVGDNRGVYRFLDDTADRQQMYAYAVSTINHYGKESSQTTIEMNSDP